MRWHARIKVTSNLVACRDSFWDVVKPEPGPFFDPDESPDFPSGVAILAKKQESDIFVKT